MRESKRHRGGQRPVKGMGQPSGKDRSAHEAARGFQVGGRALSQLSDLGAGLDDLDAVWARMKVESDRGAAIMGSALIEGILTETLVSAMVNKDSRQSLFDDKGAPLATFSNKTIVAYALDLIDAETRDHIDVIRQIRNAFSHALLPIDFNTREVDAACRKITKYASDSPELYLPWRQVSPRYVFTAASVRISENISRRRAEWAEAKLARLELDHERAVAALDKRGEQNALGNFRTD